MADYVYRNQRDTIRVRIFQRESGRWDYDVFLPNGDIKTFSEDSDDFRTKRDALSWAATQYGPLKSINPEGSVVNDAWRRRAASAASSGAHGARKKTPAQLDREIAEALTTGSPVTISVHEDEDEETGEDRYTISDDGGEFDDVEEDSAPDVQGDIDERRLHYRSMGRRVVIAASPGRDWR